MEEEKGFNSAISERRTNRGEHKHYQKSMKKLFSEMLTPT